MTEEHEDENLDNPAEYSAKSDFSKAEIVKLQIQRCNEIRSKEMRAGYFNMDKLGNKIYIPDSRQEWVASVIALKNLLTPEILRDKEFREKKEKIIKMQEKATEIFGIYPVKTNHGDIIVETDKPKFIPYLEQPFPIKKRVKQMGSTTNKIMVVPIPGLYNDKFHSYWDRLVEIYDELYAELNVLIDKCNYFKQQTAY